MRFGIILGSVLLCVNNSAMAQTPSTTKHKHPHLHHALWALHHAHHELHMSKENYGGHKEKALHDIHNAITHIKAILKHEKDDAHATPTKHELSEAHRKYAHHPHLHHALDEVKEAHHQLRVSKDDFGGHRAKALHDMDHAVHQIQLVLKHAKAAETKTSARTARTTAAKTTASKTASTR